jgi:two-component system chemotaxis response regulator CheB
MPPTFTRFLAERLTAASSLVVREGEPGAILKPGAAWIAPGDFHMNLRRDETSVRLGVFQAAPENSCRPSVDVLFRSVAEVFKENVLAVVMTGMGQDGLRGCELIKETHGQVIVQDEASSVVWGMPGYVAKAGLADSILPVTEIADEIIRMVNRGCRGQPQPSPLMGLLEPIRKRAQGDEYGT